MFQDTDRRTEYVKGEFVVGFAPKDMVRTTGDGDYIIEPVYEEVRPINIEVMSAAASSIHHRAGLYVQVQFGQTYMLSWLSPEQAESLAIALINHAGSAREADRKGVRNA